MNRRTSILLALFIVAVVGAALGVGLRGGRATGENCQTSRKVTAYKVTIVGSKVSDDHIQGRLCDTLTFTNEDVVIREVAFGPHEHHVPYDGVADRVLGKGQSLTITLNQAGSFHWHDHLHDEVEGYFTVKK